VIIAGLVVNSSHLGFFEVPLSDSLGVQSSRTRACSAVCVRALGALGCRGWNDQVCFRSQACRSSGPVKTRSASARDSRCPRGKAWNRAVVAALRGPQRQFRSRRVRSVVEPCQQDSGDGLRRHKASPTARQAGGRLINLQQRLLTIHQAQKFDCMMKPMQEVNIVQD